ncbi:uncharacterized protein BDW47DRAFT_122506 [Aspergillus candidus]|uniref:Cytochrome b561 domain-containing protein n=1 Tax=Aspergillus candidus TaxID=41067 RepID=A0A2I2FLE1_ASPCN|nr:hypothetical protein BDW47DRAFT_122506 [Aspergillus candidus]PLB41458.1 hypothetical protein BDW47DRAFT_122506 [Aspergillus candidus]
MSSNSDLTEPGSSTYASNTLHVGDGTWDSGRDTFLLPNLMGVNFETMRYNGMGNRFRDMPQYHTFVIAHAVIATIVFMGIVPLSVMLIRYYSRSNPFWAFKLHVWCQVLTLFLTTVVFVLGWFAVGPRRSLTNPHHGIGLAIYVMVIVQVLWGWLLHKVESKRERVHVPLKLVLHRWLGRALALLGLIQIPLGLTLYGSPKSLFILFALAAFGLLLAFFVLSYLYDTDGYHMGSDYDSRHSYISGPSAPPDRPQHNFGRMAAAGAGAAGLAALFRRRSKRDHDDSQVSYTEDKYSDEESRRGGWGGKLFKLGALGGGAFLAKRLFDRRRDRDDDTESGRYSRAHTRSDSMTEATMSRMEDGRRPEPTHRTPLNRPPSRPPSRPQSPGSSEFYDSTYLSQNDHGGTHKARNAFLGAGAFAAIKNIFNRRRGDDDDQRRIEELRRREIEDERLARANSKRRYTGDGYYPQNRRDNRRTQSFSATDLTSDMTRPPRGPAHGHPGPAAYSGPVDGPHSELPHATPIHHPSDIPPPDVSDFTAGPAMGAAPGPHRRRSGSRHREDNVESPPVSLKVKMHEDGRHVTLRRLTEEEAAANRENRRRDRRSSRRRTGSASSLSGNESGYSRWRRVEELERQQQEQMQREQEAAAAASTVPPAMHPPSNMDMSHMAPPPPPHVPSSLPYGPGSVTSPGTWTGTEASGDYANNRRRRRAERARTRQERQQPSVDFT